MINKVNYSPSFQKQLKAKATIQKFDKPEKCYIYELDSKTDSDYFEKVSEKLPIWKDVDFYEVFEMHLQDPEDIEHIYVMESEDEELLGAMEVDDDDRYEEYQTIEYIATSPLYSSANDVRQRKYIGQTLLAFATRVFDKKHTKGLCIPTPICTAVDFYINKCNFVPTDPDTCELVLHKEGFEELVKRNEENTKGKMELIG